MAQRAFVHILAEEAYALGASYVEVDWQDEKLTQIRLKQAQGHFHYVPESKIAARR
jgi:leucyl aminopeptidase (aminopeptidase T)